jgi:hypothetical protein
MDTYIIWLIKVLLAHLLTDFVFQPGSWIKNRRLRHFLSPHLYLHGFITAFVVFLFIGIHYWFIILIIFITHILIDGIKSYMPDRAIYFLLDQLLHLLIIAGCWYFVFFQVKDLKNAWMIINTKNVWLVTTAFIFLSMPAGIIVGQLTNSWRKQIQNPASLESAGIVIGIIERCLILLLVMEGQFAAIGLLIAAKGILRFRDNDRTEIKTEYVLIGTLFSISIAIITGTILLKLIS